MSIQEETFKLVQVPCQKKQTEDQQDKTCQQEQTFHIEVDTEDPAQTRESKRQKLENRQERRTSMEQWQLVRRKELHESHEDLLWTLWIHCSSVYTSSLSPHTLVGKKSRNTG